MGAPGSAAGDSASGAPRLGPYVLLRELGRGGMGAVYRAHRPDLKRDYALKVILPGQDASPDAIARFRREAQAARALHFAHAHGVLHRDIKPANILVTAEGQARVADFGLAKTQDAGPESHRLTKSGAVLGTPTYMSPEQARGDATLDARADVWSLGATLPARPGGLGPAGVRRAVGGAGDAHSRHRAERGRGAVLRVR